MPIFSGSYHQDDVHILLKPIQIENTPLVEKEHLIQQRNGHYSEMITYESLPSKPYLTLFHQVFSQNKTRLATDLVMLATQIDGRTSSEIVLVSLARAGTPIGVILKRILQQQFQRDCHHYTLSIIRDRGIDTNALKYITQQHNPKNIIFIDGWTGKGVIAQELTRSITYFNHQHQTQIKSGLYVLNDIAGVAKVTASFDDYLIPSSLLNATISGLISRSILNKKYLHHDDFHGCLFYKQFLKHDLSHWFVNETLHMITNTLIEKVQKKYQHHDNQLKAHVQQRSMQFIQKIKNEYQMRDVNWIKPGIGEATRVLLRRIPKVLILKNLRATQTQHLILLAKEKQVMVIEDSTLPYQAVALIKDINHG